MSTPNQPQPGAASQADSALVAEGDAAKAAATVAVAGAVKAGKEGNGRKPEPQTSAATLAPPNAPAKKKRGPYKHKGTRRLAAWEQGDITTTYDWKVNAGADAIVKRKEISPQTGSPSYFKCNLAIPMIPAGRQRLYFLPDRILVWDTTGVGAVGFEQLGVKVGKLKFIEGGDVPSDAQVVDKTWKYLNKKGGPDRRFNDNVEIPIVLYEEILLTSKSGLQELFQLSRTGLGIHFDAAVKKMASAISEREEAKTEDDYIKCPCQHCDIFIEFPARGLGQSIACPHCGMETVLFKPTSLPT